jgi:hypothetical protein
MVVARAWAIKTDIEYLICFMLMHILSDGGIRVSLAEGGQGHSIKLRGLV